MTQERKTLTIMLMTSPYMFENTKTAMKITEAALAKGYRVKLFAMADAVHNFTTGQKPQGVPNPEEGFKKLIDKGLIVELCGTCLHFRGISEEQLMENTEASSLRGLSETMKESDVFITLSF
ncbi:MAG: DsrE/DsrF/TusD sulfur relay family protein [Candidatus Bathyarchaeia archaeon]